MPLETITNPTMSPVVEVSVAPPPHNGSAAHEDPNAPSNSLFGRLVEAVKDKTIRSMDSLDQIAAGTSSGGPAPGQSRNTPAVSGHNTPRVPGSSLSIDKTAPGGPLQRTFSFLRRNSSRGRRGDHRDPDVVGSQTQKLLGADTRSRSPSPIRGRRGVSPRRTGAPEPSTPSGGGVMGFTGAVEDVLDLVDHAKAEYHYDKIRGMDPAYRGPHRLGVPGRKGLWSQPQVMETPSASPRHSPTHGRQRRYNPRQARRSARQAFRSTSLEDRSPSPTHGRRPATSPPPLDHHYFPEEHPFYDDMGPYFHEPPPSNDLLHPPHPDVALPPPHPASASYSEHNFRNYSPSLRPTLRAAFLRRPQRSFDRPQPRYMLGHPHHAVLDQSCYDFPSVSRSPTVPMPPPPALAGPHASRRFITSTAGLDGFNFPRLLPSPSGHPHHHHPHHHHRNHHHHHQHHVPPAPPFPPPPSFEYDEGEITSPGLATEDVEEDEDMLLEEDDAISLELDSMRAGVPTPRTATFIEPGYPRRRRIMPLPDTVNKSHNPELLIHHEAPLPTGLPPQHPANQFYTTAAISPAQQQQRQQQQVPYSNTMNLITPSHHALSAADKLLEHHQHQQQQHNIIGQQQQQHPLSQQHLVLNSHLNSHNNPIHLANHNLGNGSIIGLNQTPQTNSLLSQFTNISPRGGLQQQRQQHQQQQQQQPQQQQQSSIYVDSGYNNAQQGVGHASPAVATSLHSSRAYPTYNPMATMAALIATSPLPPAQTPQQLSDAASMEAHRQSRRSPYSLHGNLGGNLNGILPRLPNGGLGGATAQVTPYSTPSRLTHQNSNPADPNPASLIVRSNSRPNAIIGNGTGRHNRVGRYYQGEEDWC